MARDDWTALVTEPAQEYLAHSELQRLGLHPYLPQIRRRWTAPHGKSKHMRCFPLFPRYILLPIQDIQPQVLFLCRGLKKIKPVLSDQDGRPWRAPNIAIKSIRTAEQSGEFDVTLQKGDKIQINEGILEGIQALLEKTSNNTVELFAPLLGGARVKMASSTISKASEI